MPTEDKETSIGRIYDKPIRDCLLEATREIRSGELEPASAKISEALAAFKFMMFAFFSDFRVTGVAFKKMKSEIDFPNLLADLAFKLIFGSDEQALKLLMTIGSKLRPVPDGSVHSISEYRPPVLKDEKEAWNYLGEVLRIIVTYQDRIPRSTWRQ